MRYEGKKMFQGQNYHPSICVDDFFSSFIYFFNSCCVDYETFTTRCVKGFVYRLPFYTLNDE